MSKYGILLTKLRAGLIRGETVKEDIGLILGLVSASLEYTDNKSYDEPQPLSKIVEYGKGRCQHFAMLFYVLAKSTGLEVIIDYGVLYNTKPRVVKKIKDKEIEHYWCRVNIGKRWIRVDPTANLTEFGLKNVKVFNEQYHQVGSCRLDNEKNPTKLILG